MGFAGKSLSDHELREDDDGRRENRLRALWAMLVYAAREAEALGEPDVEAALANALQAATVAAKAEVRRCRLHDA